MTSITLELIAMVFNMWNASPHVTYCSNEPAPQVSLDWQPYTPLEANWKSEACEGIPEERIKDVAASLFAAHEGTISSDEICRAIRKT